jgi:enoyl-CoA hydratase/carnithine racemase
MDWIETTTEDQVMILKLNRGVTNAINGELLKELGNLLQMVRDKKEITALVITSANDKFFSLGFDLPELYLLEPQEFKTFFVSFYHFCMDLYTLPKPAIAALTGHAIAGGFILASCCDYRFISQGKKFCALNEIHLGAPVPHFADAILRQMIGDHGATEMMYSGKMIPPEEARQIGIVDALLPAERVCYEATVKARELGRLPTRAFAAIKANKTRSVAEEVRRRFEEDMALFLEFWFTEDVRERLKEAMKKF